jgi:enamine deaminase RidA (YjgF/YER057c/UK114 family)
VKRDFINPPGVFEHPAYSAIVSVTAPQTFHFIAGRCSTDENYKCHAPGDFLGQYHRIMETLDYELKSVGATWDDVVYRRIFTLDVDAFLHHSATDPVIQGYFNPEKMPASTLIGVTRLSDPDFLLEVDLLAITG